MERDGCLNNVCNCNKVFPKLLKTVNWKAYYHGDGDEAGRGERRERSTFPKLSQSLGIDSQVDHLTVFYILWEMQT